MRRRSFALAGAALALAGPIATGRFATGAVAQDGTPAALPAPLAGWVTGWEAQPLIAEPIAAAYVDDAVYEEVATGVVRTGRPEILAYLTDFFAAFADARAEVEEAFAAGEHGAATWTFNGRYTGQLPGFPPGTGQPVTFRGASILDLRGGMIARETQYFDVYGLLVQLGIIPVPDGTPAP
jgi:steroid delta-isomerase-like uncharacterized protein